MTKFRKRSKGIGIIRIQNYVPGKLLTDFPIENSETVILHYKGRSVIVEDIMRETNDTLVGKILGFEPPAMQIGDLKINDSVRFSEDEVISAGGRREDTRAKIAITIDEGILKKVDKLAKSLKLNRSKMVENLLCLALDNAETLESMGLFELAKVVQRVKDVVYPSKLKPA